MFKTIIIAATLSGLTLGTSSTFAASGKFNSEKAGYQFSDTKELSKGHGWTKRRRPTCDWSDISCWFEIRE